MIWAKNTLHHGFRVAEECYPTNYNNSVEWYKDFVSWLGVSSSTKLRDPGKKVNMY